MALNIITKCFCQKVQMVTLPLSLNELTSALRLWRPLLWRASWQLSHSKLHEQLLKIPPEWKSSPQTFLAGQWLNTLGQCCFSALFQDHPVIQERPIWKLKTFDVSRVEGMMLQVVTNRLSHQSIPPSTIRGLWDLLRVASHLSTLGSSIYSFVSFQQPSVAVLKQRPHSDNKTKIKMLWNYNFPERLLAGKDQYTLPFHWKASSICSFLKKQQLKQQDPGERDPYNSILATPLIRFMVTS